MYRSSAAFLSCVGVALGVAPASEPCRAEDGGWQNKPYPYSVVSQDVGDVLRNFGYNAGLRVSVSQDVKGTVLGHAGRGSAREFLDGITKSNDLDWYSDGTVLYVSPASEEETTVVDLHGYPFGVVQKGLADANLLDARYRVMQHGTADAAVVSGPPSFVTVIRQAIEAQTGSKHEDRGDLVASQTLTVFRGSQSSSIRLP